MNEPNFKVLNARNNEPKLLNKKEVAARDGNLPVTVTGNFPSEDAQELVSKVLRFGKRYGSMFDVSALDGTTVADDWPAVLHAVGRGNPVMKGASPERDEFGAGFAIAVPVLRDGSPESHVVLDSAFVRPPPRSAKRILRSCGAYAVS